MPFWQGVDVAVDDIALLVFGSAIVLGVLYDLASTTISLSTVRGPLSTRLSSLLWSLGRRTAGTKLRFLQRVTGPMLVITILVAWLVALTVGWTLIFTIDGALSSSATPDQQSSPVQWVDALFFVFGNLIGRSSSNLSPEAEVWSSAVAAMALSGVALLTLALAWILPVVGAVVHKRALAAKLSALGGTPQEIVLTSWDGRTLGDLNLHLLPLIGELTLLAQRHLAYPVIHYFHSTTGRTAIGARLAALDEALTVIRAGGLDDAERGTGLDRSVTEPLRQSVSDYLSTLEYVFITAQDDPPPPPGVDQLMEAGAVDDDTPRRVRELCEDIASRRSLLLGYVRHDGWDWQGISRHDEPTTEDPEDER